MGEIDEKELDWCEQPGHDDWEGILFILLGWIRSSASLRPPPGLAQLFASATVFLQLVKFTQQTSPVNTNLFRDRGWKSRTGKASPCSTSPPNWETSSLCGGSSTRHNAGFSICRMSMEEPRWALRGMRSLPGEALIVQHSRRQRRCLLWITELYTFCTGERFLQ